MSALPIIIGVVSGLALLLVVSGGGMYLWVKAKLAKGMVIQPEGTPRKVLADAPVAGGGPTLDVYLPAAVDGPPPLVLLVPGDAPDFLLKNAKDWQLFLDYAGVLTDRGLAVAVMNHSSTGNYKKLAAMMAEVDQALDLLRQRGEELGYDPDRLAVWSFSGSGGLVAAHLIRQPRPEVKALLSFYGVLDLADYPMSVPEETVRTWSLPPTLTEVQELPCPVYVVNAGEDRKMINKGFHRLAAMDTEVQMRMVEGGEHGFETSSPPEVVREELDRAVGFIEAATIS